VRAKPAKEGRMLVLSRKKDERIVINNDITIVVVEIRGDKVRLGVEAPKEVPVHRREVYDAISRGEPADALPESSATENRGSEVGSAESPQPADHQRADPA
jgi:carbon storage regulator